MLQYTTAIRSEIAYFIDSLRLFIFRQVLPSFIYNDNAKISRLRKTGYKTFDRMFPNATEDVKRNLNGFFEVVYKSG